MEKLRKNNGFSFTEMLAALLIVLLVTDVMSSGVAFAARMYVESLTQSESKILMSTLSSVIQSDLASTQKVILENNPPSPGQDCEIRFFFSRTYGSPDNSENNNYISVTVNDTVNGPSMSLSDYGEVALGYVDDSGTLRANRLVSSGAYSKFKLKAKVTVTCDTSMEGGSVVVDVFHVEIDIRSPGKTDSVLCSSFDVLPLNRIKVEAA